MLQPRIAGVRPSLDTLTSTFTSLSLRQPFAVRHASHAAQGRANGPTDSAGRRLGAKKSNTEHVVAGNIIFKQRGTKWHPGENVGIGKDHTLYALTEGYVRYYRNPRLHPKRRYIGVALAREGKESVLPTPPNAPSRRRVGMTAVPIKVVSNVEAENFLESHLTSGSKPASSKKGSKSSPTTPAESPIMRAKGYRVANIQLVRNAAANEVQVRPFDKKDRWFAWRVRQRKHRDKKLARATAGAKKRVGRQQQQQRNPKSKD